MLLKSIENPRGGNGIFMRHTGQRNVEYTLYVITVHCIANIIAEVLDVIAIYRLSANCLYIICIVTLG